MDEDLKDWSKSKMYILIKDNVDLGHAILGSAHASLGGFLRLGGHNDKSMENWLNHSFRKVVCKVSNEEFEKAKTYFIKDVDYTIMVEMALNNDEITLVFKPRTEWPPFFKSLKLYRS